MIHMKQWLIAALALAAPAVFAAQLVIDIPACNSYALTGNTVTCSTTPGLPPPVDPPPPLPPPVPTPGALADFDMRANLGQWAAWKFWQASEFEAFKARCGCSDTRINQQINFYNHTFVVPGNRVGNMIRFFNHRIGMFLTDTNGAADAFLAAEAAAQGKQVIGPLR